jgi:Protein of unknown function (DUF3135)
MNDPANGETRVLIERLTGLYQTDPGQFERMSREIIRQTIESFPEHHQKRAQILQFRIDCALRKYHDPVARMNRMVEIFWEYFQQFYDVLHDPEKVLEARNQKRQPGKILPFRRGESRRIH